MALVDLVMPKMGESIMEATILKWHKKQGDPVEQDETVLEIATDKVDTEVPCSVSGVIEEILFNENDVVPVGSVIARVRETGSAEKSSSVEHLQPVFQHTEHTPPAITGGSPADTSPEPPAPAGSNRFYSPLVMTIASREGIGLAELEQIPGSGNEHRVTKKDILEYVENKRTGRGYQAPTVQAPSASLEIRRPEEKPVHGNDYGGNVEIVEMDRMRKLIAKHMVDSVQTSPHVTSFSEADVTNLVLWREKIKKGFEKRENTRITFTPLFIEAIVRCIKKFPLINSSLNGDKIIIKKDINIGMAAALPSGNLIVPVIKNADQLNLVGLARQVNNLADGARNNKLKPEDIQDGTFTLTNVGSFGSLMGTPIINQPQVAILAVGTIKKRPVVIETAQGDSIAIRHIMYLSMSYDHRIIDGSLGATFLSAVARELENFDPERDY